MICVLIDPCELNMFCAVRRTNYVAHEFVLVRPRSVLHVGPHSKAHYRSALIEYVGF